MRRRGFTLVELLVVIGIIALLISILLPSLNKAREQAKSVQCMAQLRQVGQALYAYASASKGYLPGWSSVHYYPDDKFGPGEGDQDGLGWQEQLEPYLAAPDSRVYQCPKFGVIDQSTYFLSSRYVQRIGKRNLQLSDVRLSTEFILSGDCTGAMWYKSPFGVYDREQDDVDKDDATQQCLRFFGEADGINVHREGLNVLFADGHVGTFKRFEPREMTYHPSKMLSYAEMEAVTY